MANGLSKKQLEQVAEVVVQALAARDGAMATADPAELETVPTAPSVGAGMTSLSSVGNLPKFEAPAEAPAPAKASKARRKMTQNPKLAGMMRFRNPKFKGYSILVFFDEHEKRFQHGALAEGDTYAHELTKELLQVSWKNPVSKKIIELSYRATLKSIWGADVLWAQTTMKDIPLQEETWAEFNVRQPLVAAA